MDSDEQVPLNLWLPNLTRIVDLCASALAAYAERRKFIKDRHTMPEPNVVEAPSPESYCLVRRCVLAFEFPECVTNTKDIPKMPHPWPEFFSSQIASGSQKAR